MQALIVTEPFGQYRKGDQITDTDAIKAVRESNPHQVVAVNVPDAPSTPPAPVASPAASAK